MSRYRLVENEDVEMMIESSKKGMHRTMEGQMVRIGSPECRTDILKRMDDMGYHRDDQSYGSDARTYFTGIMKVLRRKLRENDKIAESEGANVQDEGIMLTDKEPSRPTNESKKLNEAAADRMLKLAGLID